MTEDGPPAGTLLLVCTANVCRSPLAERVMRGRLSGHGWLGAVPVASAGTRAAEGQLMCEVSSSLLEPGEAVADGHIARQATSGIVEAAGLVLVMEREQRGEIARIAPGSQSKVFTLRELDVLGEEALVRIEQGADRPQDLAGLARLLHSVRGLRAPVPLPEPKRRPWWRKPEEPPDPLTIVDGHGRSEPEHLAAVTDVRAVTSSTADTFLAIAGGR